MNIALWIVAIVLGVAFLAAGLLKATQPKAKLAENMAWVEDFSDGTVKFIGWAEVLGGIGLVLPAAVNIAPILVPIAATCLAVTMVLAAIVHLRRGEASKVPANIGLFALAAFVAVMRFGPNAF
ncbi:DoxX family protein [Gordonia crocea]|uniref:DoxX family protein n=1 Tax=Gordonia crocea TaxID=589162 RepID=A0A7M3SUX5_9ACTN|nr:DoxX family protein [Gordonia crocea]GED96449.1 hypothetical protein nbrc107697_04880 [Gordonia crocea]